MNQEILEILIGKHLDGEITTGEQRILDVELQRDRRAAELLAELKELHDRSSEFVASSIIGRGAAPTDIFERAWQQAGVPSFQGKTGQQAEHPVGRTVKRVGYVRLAVGVAAGFLLGLVVQFMLHSASSPPNEAAAPDVLARNLTNPIELQEPSFPALPTDSTGNPIRNVDWYQFTDNQGNHWLIEGLRESTVRPAAYNTDL